MSWREKYFRRMRLINELEAVQTGWACSAVVARLLCTQQVPGSIPGRSKSPSLLPHCILISLFPHIYTSINPYYISTTLQNCIITFKNTQLGTLSKYTTLHIDGYSYHSSPLQIQESSLRVFRHPYFQHSVQIRGWTGLSLYPISTYTHTTVSASRLCTRRQ